MGKVNHTIHVEPISVNGITIYDNQMCVAQSISQISCVVGLKKNKKVKSKASIPLRLSNVSSRSSRSKAPSKGCIARWYNNEHKDSEGCTFTFETKLDGKNPKVFEFSIRLKRGDEELDIGVTSLTFVGVVLTAELDVPIYQTTSKEAKQMSLKGKEKGGVFNRSKKPSNGFFMEEIRSQLQSHARGEIKTFKGGDGGRSYALQEGSSMRIRCTCVPSQGGVDFNTLQNMIKQEREKAETSVLQTITTFDTPNRNTQFPQHLQNGTLSNTSSSNPHARSHDRYAIKDVTSSRSQSRRLGASKSSHNRGGSNEESHRRMSFEKDPPSPFKDVLSPFKEHVISSIKNSNQRLESGSGTFSHGDRYRRYLADKDSLLCDEGESRADERRYFKNNSKPSSAQNHSHRGDMSRNGRLRRREKSENSLTNFGESVFYTETGDESSFTMSILSDYPRKFKKENNERSPLQERAMPNRTHNSPTCNTAFDNHNKSPSAKTRPNNILVPNCQHSFESTAFDNQKSSPTKIRTNNHILPNCQQAFDESSPTRTRTNTSLIPNCQHSYESTSYEESYASTLDQDDSHASNDEDDDEDDHDDIDDGNDNDDKSHISHHSWYTEGANRDENGKEDNTITGRLTTLVRNRLSCS